MTSAAAIDAIVMAAASDSLKDPHAVGMSIGLVRAGRRYRYHFGAVDKARTQRPDDATLYPIASITKTFTGALLAQAVIDRKLALDDDIRRYLEGAYPNLEFEQQPIRLKHLLNHRSGLPFILPNPPEAAPDFVDSTPYPLRVDRIVQSSTREDFYAALHKVALTSAPGVHFQYSNAAAQLAGYVLERVYGQDFESLLRARILRPLGMADTAIELTPAQAARVAAGYDENGVRYGPGPTQFQGAGAIKSTLPDMLKYADWQLAEKAPMTRLSHTPTVTDGDYAVGLNWQMLSAGGRRVIWQDGAIPGFANFCILQPEAELALVILSNELDATTLGRLSIMANRIMTAIDARSVAKP